MIHMFSVDVEDWFQTNDFNFAPDMWAGFGPRVDRNTRILLDLFDEFSVKGTFFTLGWVALHYPELVREIASRGHEIASHGMSHQLLTGMARKEIEQEIVKSKALLEDVTGKEVVAFRAPSWSISKNNLYVLEMLQSHGYKVDSSLQPFATPLSGMSGVPKGPFHPILNGVRLSILEIPSCTTSVCGLTFPFSGGLYLRVFPLWWIKHCLRKVGKQRTGMIYTHPWEIDADQPRLQASWIIRFVHYYHLKTTLPKIQGLFRSFSFAPIKEVIGQNEYQDVSL